MVEGFGVAKMMDIFAGFIAAFCFYYALGKISTLRRALAYLTKMTTLPDRWFGLWFVWFARWRWLMLCTRQSCFQSSKLTLQIVQGFEFIGSIQETQYRGAYGNA